MDIWCSIHLVFDHAVLPPLERFLQRMTKKKFMDRYPGPRGKHLSCLTQTSIAGSFKEEDQKSIHPGKRRAAKRQKGDENGSAV